MNGEIAELIHYASPYYDPEKAHEYYLKTRELKGRRSVTKLNDQGKETWAYTKQSINEEKKAKVKEEQTSRDEKIKAFRAQAKETRERISERLKQLNEALTESTANRRQSVDSRKKSDLESVDERKSAKTKKISEERDAKIEALMNEKIPENLSKEERARRVAERNEKIAKLRGDAKAETSKLSESVQEEKESIRTNASARKTQITENAKQERKENSEDASARRTRVAAQLKTSIAAAREAYKQAKESLDSSYEEILQQEFDKIAAEMPKVTKRKSKKKK